MSGFLGQISGLINNGATTAMPGLLTQIIGNAQGATGGGLSGLLQQFESAGLGEHVSSWPAFGENLSLTAEHVIATIPPVQMQGWATLLGISPNALAPLLANILPLAVDQATTEDNVPVSDATEDAVSEDSASTPPSDIAGIIGNMSTR